ncbi:MAG: FliH/SctL family protein [Clostridiaceae bacterium]|nr:hypothetical protein [Eubacteriales bacterium]
MIRIDKDSYLKGGAAERDKKVIKSWELAELFPEEEDDSVDLRRFLTEHLGESHEAVNVAAAGDAAHPLNEEACEALLRAFDPRAEVEAQIERAKAAAAKKAAEKPRAPRYALPTAPAGAPEGEPPQLTLREAEERAEEMLSAARRMLDEAELEAEAIINGAKRTAEAELGEARAHADQMLDEAAAKRQSVFAQARDEGYAEGVAASRTALLKVREDYDNRLKGFLEQARLYNEERDAQFEKNVLEMSFEVAESILSTTLERDSDPFFALVRRAIEQLNAKTRFLVRLNKREYDRFMEYGEEAMRERLSETPFSVVCDGSLEPGALLLQADEGSIDAGVKTQLERAKKLLGAADEEA